MGKFNLMWGVVGFVVGAMVMDNIGLGVAFAIVFGLLLFPNDEEEK